MNKFFKSIAAFSVALLAVACSNSDDLASNPSDANAVEGIPMSIEINAGVLGAGGQQASSRVAHNGVTWTPEPGAEIQWHWDNTDMIYAVSKRTGKYIGRLEWKRNSGHSHGDGEDTEWAVFESPNGEGLKVQDGETVVFWYLGKEVEVEKNTWPDKAGVSFPKFDIANAASGKLTLDFSNQTNEQNKGEFEIMAKSAVVTVDEVNGKLVATAEPFVMNHLTSRAETTIITNCPEDYRYGVGSSGFIDKVNISGVLNKATFDLANEKIISTETGEVTIWHNTAEEYFNPSTNSLFTWTIIPGKNTPTFTYFDQRDTQEECHMPTFIVPEAYFVQEYQEYWPLDYKKNEDGTQVVDKEYKWHLYFTPSVDQPRHVQGSCTGMQGSSGYINWTTANLGKAVGHADYPYGFQLMYRNGEMDPVIDPMSAGLIQSFPFLASDLSLNEAIYKNADISLADWKDAFVNLDTCYSYKCPLNIGNCYKYVKVGSSNREDRLFGNYVVPSVADWMSTMTQYRICIARLSDTGQVGLIVGGENGFPAERQAMRLGSSQVSKFNLNGLVGGVRKFIDEEDPHTYYFTSEKEITEDMVVTDVSTQAIKEAHCAFIPVASPGMSYYGHAEWANMGVYQTSTVDYNLDAYAFFFGIGKKIEIRPISRTDRTLVRLINRVVEYTRRNDDDVVIGGPIWYDNEYPDDTFIKWDYKH